MMRAPVAPMGWPSATAPPFTFTLSCGDADVLHRGHGDHGEGLVHLVQVDVGRLPAGLGQHLLDRAHGRGGEPLRLVRVGGLRDHASPAASRRASSPRASRHHHERRGAVGDGRGGGGRDEPVLVEGRAQRRDLLDVHGEGRLVVLHHLVALAAGDGDGGDLVDEEAGLARVHRARRRFLGVRVHLLAREAVLLGRLVGEDCPWACRRRRSQARRRPCGRAPSGGRSGSRRAPWAAGAGALVIDSMPPATTMVASPASDLVGGHHRRLHGRAAHLVDRGAGRGLVEARAERRLAGGRLALAGGKHASHDEVVDLLGADSGLLERGLDGRRRRAGRR